jgi:2-hydroxy-3-keto-5-methylthiopentenyl-1-phosphate phosphatase
MKNTRPYVFCDFDGTITSKESLMAVLEHFVPDKWHEVGQKLMSGSITLRKGVREVLEAIPSSLYPETLEFVRQIPLRAGFEEFLDFLGEKQIPFVVISGGVRGMVEAGLGDLISRVEEIFAADVDDSGPYLKVNSDFEGGDELVAKVDVMDRFDADFKIVIGDGITDRNMAKHGDLVFARSRLSRYLLEKEIDHIKWKDFNDIRGVLEKLEFNQDFCQR